MDTGSNGNLVSLIGSVGSDLGISREGGEGSLDYHILSQHRDLGII